MTTRDRAFMTRLCAKIEEAYPETVAIFEGSAHPDLQSPDDGYLYVEILNMPTARWEEFLAFAEPLTAAHFFDGGGMVVLNLWSPEETMAHFAEDYLRAVLRRLSMVWSDDAKSRTFTQHGAMADSQELRGWDVGGKSDRPSIEGIHYSRAA